MAENIWPTNDNGEKIPVKLVDGTVIGHVNRVIIENGLGTCEIWIDDEAVMTKFREGVSGNVSIGPFDDTFDLDLDRNYVAMPPAPITGRFNTDYLKDSR